MKTILIAALALLGLTAFAPQAEAGGYRDRYRRSYDDCDRPRYRSSYRDDCRYYERPVTYYRYAPSRSYYHSSYDYCAPRRYYSSRPRVSFSFGF